MCVCACVCVCSGSYVVLLLRARYGFNEGILMLDLC